MINLVFAAAHGGTVPQHLLERVGSWHKLSNAAILPMLRCSLRRKTTCPTAVATFAQGSKILTPDRNRTRR